MSGTFRLLVTCNQRFCQGHVHTPILRISESNLALCPVLESVLSILEGQRKNFKIGRMGCSSPWTERVRSSCWMQMVSRPRLCFLLFASQHFCVLPNFGAFGLCAGRL